MNVDCLKVVLILALLVLNILIYKAHSHTNEVPANAEACRIALLGYKKTLSFFFRAVEEENLKDLLSFNKVNTSYKNSAAILHYAALIGKSKVIHILISKIKVDVNTKDQNDWTALHYAVLNRDIPSRIDTIYALIELGVDIDKLDKLGYKPSDYVENEYGFKSYSQKQKEKLIKMSIKTSAPKVAKLFPINHKTLSSWVYLYKKEKGLIMKKRSSYSPEEKEEVVNLALKRGVPKTAKMRGIHERTIGDWMLQYKRDNQIPIRPVYSQKQKDEAIKLADKIGIKEAAKKMDISLSTLGNWVWKSKEAKGLRVKRKKHYSQEEKDKIIELVRRSNIRKIAKELGIGRSALSLWLDEDNKKRGISIQLQKKYSPEYKNKAVALAFEIGVKQASKNLGVLNETLSSWIYLHRKKKGLLKKPRLSIYTSEEKSKFVQLALKFGIEVVAKENQISSHTLADWVRLYKDENKISRRKVYSQEQREEATELALRIGGKKASQKTGIPYTTLRIWIGQAYKEGRTRQNQVLLPYTSKQKERAVELVMEGNKIKAVAESINIPFDVLVSEVRKQEKQRLTTLNIEVEATKAVVEDSDSIEDVEVEELKIEVIKAVIEDGDSIEDVAEDFSVDKEDVAIWVEQLKIEVIKAVIKDGDSIEDVAEDFSVDKEDVATWVEQYKEQSI